MVHGMFRFQTLWEARWIFGVLLVATVVLWALRRRITWVPALVGVLLILFSISFFRDPSRTAPADPQAVVAAADGVVHDVDIIDEPEVTKGKMQRVGIFLSVFNVHTNRAPIDGKVIYSQEHEGLYLDARDPHCADKNACRTWGFQNGQTTVVVRQLTGLIARRIVGWSHVGDTLQKGERFGMIRFGSRTEVYVPLDAEVTVHPGDKVEAGSTIVARLRQQ
jgi:phosphatidylserine decarboxylase